MANPINTIMAVIVLALFIGWIVMLLGGWGPKGVK